MSTIKPPPIYEPLSDGGGKDGGSGVASLPWILYFNSLFTGDKGTPWNPTFVSLGETGVPTISGITYKLSGSLIYFKIKIVPATNTTSTAGTTHINNFPYTMQGDGACFAVSGLLGSNSGMCDQVSNNIYVPAWTTVTVPLSIVGIVEAS